MAAPLAHSARPERGVPAQSYDDHVANVVRRAVANARRVGVYHVADKASFLRAVRAAALWHDLGKLEPAKQRTLASASRSPLGGVPHQEAGVAHLVGRRDYWAAALVAAHHRGLFDGDAERTKDPNLRLRSPEEEDRAFVNDHLGDWRATHQTSFCADPSAPSDIPHQTELRIALSCLVDADHADTAAHYWDEPSPPRVRRRWGERLSRLCAYADAKPALTDRDRYRRAFFAGCLDSDTLGPVLSCSAPVGSGKTLAVMAYLVRRAARLGLRRVFVVLPFTNIVAQAAEEYRRALVLPDENPDDIVAELHHQAEFSSPESRHLAARWESPVVVTTAVAFFETLAGCHPARLRKLHQLPGSAVFVDEAHAAMPVHLWPLTWCWMEHLAESWGVAWVLGSGSLHRFWESADFLGRRTEPVEELTPAPLLNELLHRERRRVVPRLAPHPYTALDLASLAASWEGPSVVVANTIKTAATLARTMRDAGLDVLHLSTALAPQDREVVVRTVRQRLDHEPDRSWTLVATSCIEAGMDFSFRRGLRESATVAGLLQLSGRVRRHEEPWEGEVWSIRLAGEGISAHPDMRESAAILEELLANGDFDRETPSELMRRAFARSLNASFRSRRDELARLERHRRFPEVERKYRLIESDSVFAVVDPCLRARLEAGGRTPFRILVRGSVQIYADRTARLPVSACRDFPEIWLWEGRYDPTFLGYMEDAAHTHLEVWPSA
ncbi:MAG: CRISPR-associated endonuclease Cas3'' [Fimbriimonadaceae bacterium]|nr:CRISPR-associated endonuclease Cas3'' [Fimbriimonadaceae bacterium]